jgi:hypothetical protein
MNIYSGVINAMIRNSTLEDSVINRSEQTDRPILSNGISNVLGWMPELSVFSALGLLVISYANKNARIGVAGAEWLFWFGLLIIFVPTAFRLVQVKPSRQERIGLLLVLGVSLYIVKLLNSPLNFSYYDEMQTWRTVLDVVNEKVLFQTNSLLPIGPLYPGLAIVTTALTNLSHLSIFNSGVILLGFSRLLLILSLYLFYEKVSNSDQVASIATLLYMTNPNFLFFDSQFAYETLALAFAIFLLFVLVSRPYGNKERTIGMTLVAILALGTVVITHHITSYAVVTFICLWTVIAMIRKEKGMLNPTNFAIIGMIVCLVWMVYVANITINYLAPQIVDGMNELTQIIAGDASGRELFRSLSGTLAPLWERLTGYISIIIIIIGILIGNYFSWKRYRKSVIVLTLALGSLAYPASQILRLTQSGFFVAVRASEFLYISIAFVLSLCASIFLFSRKTSWRQIAIFTLLSTFLFIGGITIGRPPWMRLPGPYLVVADSRSIEAQGINAAEWTGTYLGPNNRIGTDRINGALMATYGYQDVITGISDQIPLGILFLSPVVDQQDLSIIKSGDIQYIVVDRRLSNGVPMAGFYFQMSEPGAYNYKKPIDAELLLKFDRLYGASRIFDSGDIIIYDIQSLAH